MSEKYFNEHNTERETTERVNKWLATTDSTIRRGLLDRKLIGTTLSPRTNTLDISDLTQPGLPYPLDQVNSSLRVDLTSMQFSWHTLEDRYYELDLEVPIHDKNEPSTYSFTTGTINEDGERIEESRIFYDGYGSVFVRQLQPRSIDSSSSLENLDKKENVFAKWHWRKATRMLRDVTKGLSPLSSV